MGSSLFLSIGQQHKSDAPSCPWLHSSLAPAGLQCRGQLQAGYSTVHARGWSMHAHASPRRRPDALCCRARAAAGGRAEQGRVQSQGQVWHLLGCALHQKPLSNHK